MWTGRVRWLGGNGLEGLEDGVGDDSRILASRKSDDPRVGLCRREVLILDVLDDLRPPLLDGPAGIFKIH
jgi:hypothetical protein